VVKKKCLTAGSLLCYKKGIVKECVQKNALFFYICLGYPIKSGNDRERKGEPLCVNKAVFFMRNYRFGRVFLLAIRRAIRIYKTQCLEN